MNEKILLAWSGGKDRALALHHAVKQPGYRIEALLTTVTETYDRIGMHGVRRALLHRQGEAPGYAVEEILISTICTNEEYASKRRRVLEKYRQRGIGRVFLFLSPMDPHGISEWKASFNT